MLPSILSSPLKMGVSLFIVPPLLFLFSVPLFIFGVITVSCAFAALFIRVSLVYIELSLALARNYILAVPDPSSSLNLQVSGEAPSSPSRSYARGIRRTHQYNRPLKSARTISPGRNVPDQAYRRRRSAGSAEGSTKPRRGSEQSHQHRASLPLPSTSPLPTAFYALTSGDQNRDFEGVGGWRTEFPTKDKQKARSSPPTPGDDKDDSAWTSFNRRLELPSIPTPFAARGTVIATSRGLGLSIGGAEEDAEGGGGDGRIWIPPSPMTSPGIRRRHHRRSVTTSALLHPNKSEASNNPYHQQQRHGKQHHDSGSATGHTSHRGATLRPLTKTAPAHTWDNASEGYFSLVKEADGSHTAPSSPENANVGKSMKRNHRRSLSSTKMLIR